MTQSASKSAEVAM